MHRPGFEYRSRQMGRLFATFSDGTRDEVARAEQAAEELGGSVTEHYSTILHLLVRP